MKRTLPLLLALSLTQTHQLFGQSTTVPATDTAGGRLDDVIVYGTRQQQLLKDVAVPLTVVNQKTIQQSGMLRLGQLLAEQPGIFVQQGFGAGVQMQGLGPEYILILVDGEPVIGRTGGVLDVNRISLSNVKQVEILKGPGSAQYGSEALGGIINIVTQTPAKPQLTAALRYGSYNTHDANLGIDAGKGGQRLGLQLNSYGSGGYTLPGTRAGATQNPFQNQTGQLKFSSTLTNKLKLDLSLRGFREDQTIRPYATATTDIEGWAKQTDLSGRARITLKASAKLETWVQFYTTQYTTHSYEQNVSKANPASIVRYDDKFTQWFQRLENQTTYAFSERLKLVAGAGWVKEQVASNRYDTVSTRKTNDIFYGFGELAYKPWRNTSVTAGLRYDHNRIYASSLSPKLALRQQLSRRFALKASAGAGFKAPDFRQLYLNFNNPSVGYTVFGNNSLADGLARMVASGQIQSLQTDPNSIGKLMPERSWGVNLGAEYRQGERLSAGINLFHNWVKNLIQTGIVAQKTNGQFVYSYFNAAEVRTYGLEANASWAPFRFLTATASYQLLFTANKADLDKVSQGILFGRRNGEAYRLQRSDYLGLFQRSRHLANLKLHYQAAPDKPFATARLLYRGKWGIGDSDGNLVYNPGDTEGPAHLLLNLSAGWAFNRRFTVMAGIDNLGDYRNSAAVPEQPGRTAYLQLRYNLQLSKQ